MLNFKRLNGIFEELKIFLQIAGIVKEVFEKLCSVKHHSNCVPEAGTVFSCYQP